MTVTFISKILRQLAAFGWGFVLAVLLFSWCNIKGQNSRNVVVIRDTVYLKELVRDTVITIKERLLGWVKVRPETVIISPETTLVETIWEGNPWAVVWAKGREGSLSLVALKEDSLGKALVREYSFRVGDEWVLAAGDTGLALKTRWRVKVRPFVGVEGGYDPFRQKWALNPSVGLSIRYRRLEGRVSVGRELSFRGCYYW